MSLYLVVAYDIPDDKRRLRVAQVLEGYGERTQFSVFELRLEREHFATLKHRLKELIKPETDRLSIYFLTPEALKRTIRIGTEEVGKLDEPMLL